jgi:hypothetical protein
MKDQATFSYNQDSGDLICRDVGGAMLHCIFKSIIVFVYLAAITPAFLLRSDHP